MARDMAIVTTWGNAIPGREAKALEVLMESLGFWANRAAEGKCSEPEVFIADDASGGILIIKGTADALREIAESDEGQKVLEKAQLIVSDLKSHWYYTGDAEVQRSTSMYAQAAGELGYM
jgi:hypothetical protein